MSYPGQQTNINVEPHDIITVKKITSITIRIVNLVLFTSVTVSVNLFNESGYVCDTRTLDITGEEYLAWNNNDEYLVDLVCSKLGLTPIPAPTPTIIQ